MKTIAFTNQKGGTGKTTSSVSVAAGLALNGYRVLLIDLDPQGNASTAAGIVPDEADPTIYEVLKGESTAANAIVPTVGGFDLIPTDIRQSGVEIELASIAGRDFILREALDTISSQYDIAIIDNPPALSVVTLMSLTAADGVVIALKSDYLGLNGVAALMDTIDLVKRRLNHKLHVLGVLLTFYDSRKVLARKIAEQASEGFPGLVFNTKISTTVVLEEAPAFGTNVYQYKPNSKAASQYAALTTEIIDRLKIKKGR